MKSYDLENQLFSAILRNDLSLVQSALRAGPDPRVRYYFPLSAIPSRPFESGELCVLHGEARKYLATQGVSPLGLALMRCYPECAAACAASGCKIEPVYYLSLYVYSENGKVMMREHLDKGLLDVWERYMPRHVLAQSSGNLNPHLRLPG